MLDFFPGGTLPGKEHLGPYTYTNTDVASFQDLWLAADLIEMCCLKRQKIPGWAPVGKELLVLFLRIISVTTTKPSNIL